MEVEQRDFGLNKLDLIDKLLQKLIDNSII